MAHTIYKTDAFILNAMPHGEASLVFSLFTESHGVIMARAQSVRRGNAKLKHALNRYRKASCSLVLGKLGWRLIDVEERLLPADLFSSEIKREIYAKILLWVARFQGQDQKEIELYEDVTHMVSFLGEYSFTEDDKEALEIAVALLLLYRFGYISPEQVKEVTRNECEETIFNPRAWQPTILPPLTKNARGLIALINNGITASNL
jgi:recombinational DNA repair protein (RecF pathway)